MKEYYEFIDEKSSKFWEIEVLGNSFKVRYGKIGSAGQCQEKVFGSEQEAALEADKLTKEKVKKRLYSEI